MKLAWSLGIVSAVVVHGAVILFGGIFFLKDDEGKGSLQDVELLDDVEAPTQEEKKPEEVKPEQEELTAEEEEPPDAADLVRSLETTPVDDAPALEAASLGAIEAALNGMGGGGDFGEALSFASGGRIGGTGTRGALEDQQLDEAFSLAEIDQKPRVVYQESPAVPQQMKGKKIEGVVSITFVVDAGGKVQNASVEKSTHAAFETPALDAVRKWKFEPGVRAGNRVATKMRVSVRFPTG